MNQVCGRRGGGGGGDHKNGPSFLHTCPTFTTFGQQPLYLEITFAHSVHLVGKLPGFTPVHPLNLAGQWPPHVVRKVGPSNTWLTSHVDLPTFTHLVATSCGQKSWTYQPSPKLDLATNIWSRSRARSHAADNYASLSQPKKTICF